jgi:hypothetical protein
LYYNPAYVQSASLLCVLLLQYTNTRRGKHLAGRNTLLPSLLVAHVQRFAQKDWPKIATTTSAEAKAEDAAQRALLMSSLPVPVKATTMSQGSS